ncbi:hypothetical protein HYU11_04600 [Candidatus Woesearchaeota archaeon]|nr:hypothetical protein [Candidatus Woesearchaeota archaeon]
MNRRFLIAFAIAWLIAISVSGLEQASIRTVLEYGHGPFDVDNNGIEGSRQVIDFTVKNSILDTNISHVCTWWSVYNEETGNFIPSCNGPGFCCESIGLESRELSSWNDSFYLFLGKDGSGSRNKVNANLVYLDDGLSVSEVRFGGWSTLEAVFISPVNISLNSSPLITLIIYSPQNMTPLGIAEPVYLNFSIAGNATANASFLNRSYIIPVSRSGNDSFFSLLLTGGLDSGIFRNGEYAVWINISVNGSFFSVPYMFEVNDSLPPLAGVVEQSGTIISEHASLLVNVTSNEESYLSYSLNSNGFSAPARLSRSSPVNLSMLNGSNILLVNVSDMNGNSNFSYHSFYFVQNMSREFDAAVDKQSYNISEQILIAVQSPANSTYNITVIGPGYMQSTAFPSYGPVTYFFYLSSPGNYSANVSFSYMSLINRSMMLPFEVVGPMKSSLGVSIVANDSDVDEGQGISFSAAISGNISSVSFRWDFNGDGNVDSNLSSTNFSFSRNGSYMVLLNATDSSSNASASMKIQVHRLNNLTWVVVDNASRLPVPNATFRLDGVAYPNGSAQRRAGKYGIDVSAEDYRPYSSAVEVSSNISIEILLDRIPSRYVMLGGVSFNSNGSGASAGFIPVSANPLVCSLSLNSSGIILTTPARNGTENVFSMVNLTEGDYIAVINCTDQSGVSNSSNGRFTINLSTDTLGKSQRIDQAISEISGIMPGLDPESDDYFRRMEFDKRIESSITSLERLRRDLFDMKWRRFTREEQENFTAAIMLSLESVRNSTPFSVSVVAEEEYVSYPKRSLVEDSAARIIAMSKNKVKDNERKRWVKQNLELQSHVTVTSKISIVEVAFLSGEQRRYGLVEKTIKNSYTDDNVKLLEVIPKEFAADVTDIHFLDGLEYEVLERDPVISISPRHDFIAYYSGNEAEIEKIKDSSTVLVFGKYIKSQPSGITGLFSGIDELAGSARKRLVAELVLVFVIAAIFVVYSRRPAKGPLDDLIKEAELSLGRNDYEAAKKAYGSIRSAFAGLPEKSRASVKQRLSLLCTSINVCFVKARADQAKRLIGEGKAKEARDAYSEMQSVYRIIAAERKKEVYALCSEVHGLLSR